jgi:hypothetical protein
MSATIQTTFDQYYNPAKLGEIYDNRYTMAESYIAENTIRFGQAVVEGTDEDRQVITPSATGQTFMGISIAIWQIEQQVTSYPTTSSGLYVAELVLPVLRRGAIWVRVNQDVEANDPVYFVFSDVDSTKIGNFRKDSGVVLPGSEIADLIPNALFRKAAKAGELAVVEINMP